MHEFPWYRKSKEEVLILLGTDSQKGLNRIQVKELSEIYHNTIEEGQGNSALKMILRQFTDTMVLVLLGATVISGLVGAMADAVTIMAIVVINALLGFFQEYRAESSLEEIKKLSSPSARVVRDGKRQTIPAAELLPGDIVLLEGGDKIPADLRLLETYSLEVDEAALTGESNPVEKNAAKAYATETPLAERHNMAFMGTAVTRGRAVAVVVETGMDTVMGHIAGMIKESKASMTPLQTRLDQLGKILIVICLGVCAAVALLGIYRGEGVITMLMAGISLAVAAIPEGLPAIVTVVLAVGVQRMARNHAIVRKLSAVETLGCTTVICSDKTGTLTQNQMTVKRMADLDKIVVVEGEGYRPAGGFLYHERPFYPRQEHSFGLMLDVAGYCNNAVLDKAGGQYQIQGDPTEGALLVMAVKAGWKPEGKRLREIPFDSGRKRMSVVMGGQRYTRLLVKGALDVLLERCTHVMKNGEIRVMGTAERKAYLQIQEQWAADAMRVLAFAVRDLKGINWERQDDEGLEKNLILVGLCGIVDPPRAGVQEAVNECKSAGIVPVMITGDHPATARAIARQVGIGGEEVITGPMIDSYSDEELCRQVFEQGVFARVSPQHKYRIVQALKKKHYVVAMTGDGVNDAPAVKSADIGVAMGIAGTEVTKEASAMVLADDDFTTIVKAVYEGRAIYDNIRKFIRYLLGCNIGEVLVMFLASLLGMPLPMLPIQILWVNLMTDGLPAMGLGLEPPEPGLMRRRPRPRHESIFARGLGRMIFARGFYIAAVTLLVFVTGLVYSSFKGSPDLDMARTMAVTTLVLAQLFYVFECRSEAYSPFELGFFTNRFLLGAVLCSLVLQLAVIYIPFMQGVFHTTPLTGWQWIVILAVTGSRLLWRCLQYFGGRIFFSHKIYDTIKP